jgi:hypothetical protein
MARMKIRHLVARDNADGTRRFYWQPSSPLRAEGWNTERLPDEQAAAIARAELLNADVDAWRKGEASPSAPPAVKARARKAPPGTVSALIADYKASRFWTKLAVSTTRRSYEWALDAIEAWAGDQPARGITAPAVQAFYEAQLRRVEQQGRKKVVIETPAKAAAAVRVLRLLLQVGVRLGYLTSNPASRPGISLTRKRDPLPWSPDQVLHMAAVADRLGWRSIGTAMILNSWIGQREGDVLTLPPSRVEAEAPGGPAGAPGAPSSPPPEGRGRTRRRRGLDHPPAAARSHRPAMERAHLPAHLCRHSRRRGRRRARAG